MRDNGTAALQPLIGECIIFLQSQQGGDKETHVGGGGGGLEKSVLVCQSNYANRNRGVFTGKQQRQREGK